MQAVKKLLERMAREIRLFWNWKPISLLDNDLNGVSETLSEKLKSVSVSESLL